MDFSVKGGARYATVKVRNAAAIPQVLGEFGADPGNVLRRAGLEPDAFSDPDNALPYSALGRLIGECVRATGREDFGLCVGARMGATAIGLTGLVSLHAPTVRDALEVIAAGLKTSDTGGALVLETRGAEACARYVITAPDVEGADQIVDGAVAILVNTLRAVCGPAWRASRVSLTRDPPRSKAPFNRFFDAPVEFAAPLAGVTFDAATLSWPVRNRNPEYADILAPLHQEAVANARGDIVSAVRSILRVQVAAGAATRDGVARALGLNPRTLAHRLEASGVTFSGLADEARFEAAQSLLRKDKRIAEVAAVLGFAEQSAFTRAFTRWSGTTPGRWRLQCAGATVSGQRNLVQ